MPNRNGVIRDVSLFNHCKADAKTFEVASDHGDVFTSAALDACAGWIEDDLGKSVTYGVAT